MSSLRVLRRLLLWLTSLPLLLVLLVLLLAGIAVSTETGLQGLLVLAQRVLPGQLSYSRASGRLLGPLQIEQLHYQDGPLQVTLADGEFDWRPTDLLHRVLTITRLHVNELDLQLPPSTATPTPSESAASKPLSLPDIRLPLAITIADLEGRDIHIQPADAKPIQVDAINLKAHTAPDGLIIELLEAWAPQGEVHLTGQLNPTDAYPLQAQLHWQFLTPEHGALTGQGDLKGELRDRLSVTQKITGAASLDLDGEVRQLLDKPAWSVKTKLDVADLKPFVLALAGKPLSVKLDAQGVLAQFQGQGEITTTLPELGPAALHFTAAGNTQSLQLDELRLTTPQRPLALNAKGELQFAELRFSATGQWQSLVWPLTGSPKVESAKGEFTVKGNPKDYQFQLAADLQGPDIPKGHWTLNGQGSDQAVREAHLNGQTLEGQIKGVASVAWAPALRWQADLSGDGLNPGAQWRNAPGKLDLHLKSDGSLENNTLRANALLDKFTGNVSGKMVNGNADVVIQDQNLTVKALRLKAGDAQLEAEGSLTQRWDLRWKLNAPQLQALMPGLSGTIASTGNLTGSRERPAVAANLTVQNLSYGANRIQRLRGEANVDTGGANRSRLQLNGEGLTLSGQNWKTLSLDGAGTPANHDLKTELTGDAGRFAVALSGSLQLPALLWQGRITQLVAKDTVAGTWNLDKPMSVRASARQASFDSACLSSTPTHVCLQGQWDQERGFNAQVKLDNLTPDPFKHFMPKGVELATHVNGEATVSGKAGGALQGKLNLNIAPGSLRLEANGRPLRFTLNGGSLQLDTNGHTANGQATLDLAQTGQLQASLQAQDPLGAARLNGKLNATVTDLGVIALFVPQVQNVSGQLRAAINVAGTAAKPTLNGEIRLENAGVAIPEAGIKLQNIQFTAANTGQGPLKLSGSVHSGSGELQLGGELDPLKPQVSLTIQGQDFQALNTTDLQLQLSPDLTLAFAEQQLRIDGQITVPRAHLRPGGERAGALKPSSDVVIVNKANGGGAPPKPNGIEIFAKVRVILGDDVQVETPVFKGKLIGNLLVEETPQLAPRGSGSIEVVAGNYRIYGEEIQIQRGQLLFSSSPLDNPGFDLRVARQIGSTSSDSQVTAGAQIRGTLKKPQLTLFSNPTMPDPSILSYLVLGRAPGGGESALLFKAAGALGMGGGESTKSMGDAVGLDALELQSGSSAKDTSVMLGKYLTPDLYIGYGVGLLSAVNTFNLKYRITKRLGLESTSSAIGTGADLIYTVEH
ncbi:MAG: translocation/assembly module TamB domain-containing protein [Candidatus Competibacteraceae bacterium]